MSLPATFRVLASRLHADAIFSDVVTCDPFIDLYSIDDIEIPAGDSALIHTGLAMRLPYGYYGQIEKMSDDVRDVSIGAGVIDEDYTGEIKVILRNQGLSIVTVNRGDKCARLALRRYCDNEVKFVENFTLLSMSPSIIYLKRFDPEAQCPTRATLRSAGLDLYTVADSNVPPRGFVTVNTGVGMYRSLYYHGHVASRSGLAMKGIEASIPSQDLGQVFLSQEEDDPNPCFHNWNVYEFMIRLTNHSDHEVIVHKGDRIAQLIVSPRPSRWTVNVPDDESLSPTESVIKLPPTERGDGGFGSSGV